MIEATDKTSQRGNAYGQYVVEDYTGSYRFVLFGSAYEQCASLLKPDRYVYLTGTIQQRGANQKWFKEKPDEEAEFELAVTQVEQLNDVQDKHLEQATLIIPLDMITPDLVEELVELSEAHPGPCKLMVQVQDVQQKSSVTFVAKNANVHIDKEFYHWLKVKQMDGVLSLQVN